MYILITVLPDLLAATV